MYYDVIDYTHIGNNIRKRRKELGITLLELGDEIGTSKSHISHVEKGQTSFSLRFVVAIANALSCSVDYLLGYNIEVYNDYVCSNEFEELFADLAFEEKRIFLEFMRQAKQFMNNAQTIKSDG
jgi:transcriptional regulator with XRE-family HTH domain